MDITLPVDPPLKIATSQLERACRMAKGLHLLKARLQAVHYRMLGSERMPAQAESARAWADELSEIMRAGGIPEAVGREIDAVVRHLKAV